MLLENQLVKTTWTHKNRKYYESVGYKFTNYYDALNLNPKYLPKTSKVKVDVFCDDCNELFNIPYFNYTKSLNKYSRYLCKTCSVRFGKKYQMYKNRPDYFKLFINWCERNGYKPLSIESDYKNHKTNLYYNCPKHGRNCATYTRIRNGQITGQCCKGNRLRILKALNTKEVKNVVESKNGNILLNVEEYLNATAKNLKVICGTCGEIFVTSLSSIHNSGGRCLKCGMRTSGTLNRMSQHELINIFTINNRCMIVNPQEYTGYFDTNLKVYCEECNCIYITSIRRFKENKVLLCDRCNKNISIGEKQVSKILDAYHISYISQKRFPDCKDKKTLPFDFYLPDYNICIEFDGQGHYEPFFGEESFIRTILHDGMKNNYCRWNNIKLIRIPYWKGNDIENILTKELNLKFNYKKIIYKPMAQQNTKKLLNE